MRRLLFAISIIIFMLGMTNISNAQSKPFTVVLDAGHGGHDAGAIGRPTTNREKDINLAVTLKIGQLIKQNCPDINVLYTRNTDVFVTLSDRADIANKAKADLFVSIHTNAIERSPGRLPMGVQSYTLSLKTANTNLEVEKRENSVIQFEADGAQKYSFMNSNSPESEIMYELMQDRDMKESVTFAKLAQEEMVNSGSRKDLGVLQANLAVLRLTYMPSVLLELGFISTPEEETFLMSDEGRTVMAKCIYNAISRYITQHTGRMSNLEKIDTKTVKQQIGDKEVERKQEDTKVIEELKVPKTQLVNNVMTSNTKPVFKIQILISQKNLVPGSTQFKGLKAESYKENNVYKYTYCSTTDYSEILKMKKQIADKFPDAFIIAFKDGQKINVNDAINELRLK